ncbi:hypothetical protein ACU686_45085 [Yinghuangia aomiensis]
MTQPQEVKSAERGSVTRDALARAGLAVLQRDGLDALSMRAVAAELGVRAPSRCTGTCAARKNSSTCSATR